LSKEEAKGLGFLVIHVPAAFPKLFATLSAVEGQKGFSLTSGLEKQRLALKLSSKVNSVSKSVSIPTIKISIFAEIFE